MIDLLNLIYQQNPWQKRGKFEAGFFVERDIMAEIDKWKDNGMGKCFFEEKVGITPDTKPLSEVTEKSWLNVISPAKGYYQRGNHLVVEFNGKGQFRIIRGCPNHDWTNCI